MLKFFTLFPPFRFTAFTAALRSKHGSKFISGHRLEIDIIDRICLALHETILADRFELSYLNPFTTHMISMPMAEYGRKGAPGYFADNLLIGGDASIKNAAHKLNVDESRQQIMIEAGYRF